MVLWFMVYGLWFMVYGLWFMVYGLRFMVYGLWFMVYGLWFMVLPYAGQHVLRRAARPSPTQGSTSLVTCKVRWLSGDETRNVKRFRGGLAFKAHRLVYHSTLGLSVIKKKKMKHQSLVVEPREGGAKPS